jgi:hypothetical protein
MTSSHNKWSLPLLRILSMEIPRVTERRVAGRVGVVAAGEAQTGGRRRHAPGDEQSGVTGTTDRRRQRDEAPVLFISGESNGLAPVSAHHKSIRWKAPQHAPRTWGDCHTPWPRRGRAAQCPISTWKIAWVPARKGIPI